MNGTVETTDVGDLGHVVNGISDSGVIANVG